MRTGNSKQREVFEKEIFPHLDALWRIARWLTMQNILADEIVMKTLIRAYGEWPHPVDSISNKTRLFQVLKREILGFERQKRSHPEQYLSENIEITADSEKENRQNAILAIDQSQSKMPNRFSEESFRGIIAHLRPQSRLILLLLYIGEFSYADIAFIMDFSLNSVRVILTRVRKLITINLLETAVSLKETSDIQLTIGKNKDEFDRDHENISLRLAPFFARKYPASAATDGWKNESGAEARIK